MNDYLAALLLGLSFGNLWVCALLVFSLQNTNRATCGGYLVGRALAIVALAIAVAVLGGVITISTPLLNIASGLLLLGFGGYLAATRLFNVQLPWQKARLAHPLSTPKCDGTCQDCPAHKHQQYASACAACGAETMCAAEEPEVESLTRAARRVWQREVHSPQAAGFSVGVVMGALRGAALCSKLVVLLPMLLHASVARAAGIGLTFSASSSVYPLLGFAFGAFALKLVRYKRVLFVVSCTVLVLSGAKYLYSGIFSVG